MNDDQGVFEAIIQARQSSQSVVLATVVSVQGSVPRHEGSKMVVRADGSIVGTVGGGAMEARVIEEALQSIMDGSPRLSRYSLNDIASGDPGVCGGTVQVFIEPLGIAPTLLVIGGGHVGKSLAELGKWMGFRVILSDDREEYCNRAYAPGLDEYVVCRPSEVTARVNVNTMTYVAAITRGLPIDLDLVPSLLQSTAAYIGIIGSRRRWALTVKALTTQRNIRAEALDRIRAPIGLELNAETPQEIAVSIMAEIIMTRRGGDGQPMRSSAQDIIVGEFDREDT